MAAFREHITVSGMLGVGYGVAAMTLLGYSPAEAAVGGVLAGIGGMLPDLDIPTGRPGQEIFALTGSVAPLVLVGHILKWSKLPANTEVMILLMLGMYVTIRYGAAWLIDKISVHRGMFHSIPAMLIAAEAIYLIYPNPNVTVKLLMACGVALGFFSHLLLDEVYSVGWSGPLPSLKKSFGTAIKLAGPTLGPTVVTYGLLAALTFVIGEQTGIIGPPIEPGSTPVAGQQALPQRETAAPPIVQEAAVSEDKLTDAPLFR
ncbi:metal-dependent hydrolase [Planctomicrobium piriforme]|uniref:LexA-binding, inner membrane-associated putative hydrolase n=1 Tax=Planctomicrobium piriforme TaxID=1576369 RepID=A0A1I3QDA0_9PLAN|nr:metal-dependent hydrolase [Planctomicrobium piriforme]SFJ32244.1 LexA-binding, inner membrane-associated putative hydrolase [Planctomicrobium piriforme]